VRSLQSWVSSGDDDLFFLARNMVTGAREIWQKSSSPAAVYLGNLGVYLNDTVAEEDLFLIGDSRLLYVSEGAQEIWIYDRDSGNSQEYVVDFPVQVTSPTFVHRGPDDGSFYIRFGSHEGLWLVGRDQAVTLVQAQSYPVNGAGGMSYLAAGGRLYMLNQNGEMVPLNQYDEYQPQKAYFLNNNLYFLTGDGHVATTLPDQSIYLLDERITHPVSSVWNGAPFIPFWDARTTGNKSLVLYWPETQETLQADPLNIIGLTQRMSLFDLQDQVILMAAYSRENACDGPYDPLFFEDGKLWYESDYRPIYGQATYVK